MADALWPLKQFKHRVVLPLLGALFDLKGGRFHTDGCAFEIPKDPATRPLRWRFLLHRYESRELNMVRRFIQPDDAVIELGGCLGVVSCVTNKRLRDATRHLVVEANPQAVAALQRNRDLNQAGFTIENCAVESETQASFNVNPSNITGGNLNHPTGTASPVALKIPVKTLARLHREHGPFNVLICDIEGSELAVFEQAADLFSSYRLVIVELHDWLIGGDRGVRRCQEILEKAGLKRVADERGVEAWQRDDRQRT
jgi:FkbM family methyltransferase